MANFILAHWHCILPLVAAIIVSAFLLRDKKRDNVADDESQKQVSDDRRTESKICAKSETGAESET
jgi:predicted exporter